MRRLDLGIKKKSSIWYEKLLAVDGSLSHSQYAQCLVNGWLHCLCDTVSHYLKLSLHFPGLYEEIICSNTFEFKYAILSLHYGMCHFER